MNQKLTISRLISLAVIVWLVAACNRGGFLPTSSPAAATALPESTASAGITAKPTSSATPFQPSPTPELLAARVNGEEIPLSTYQAELARFRAAVGRELSPPEQQSVLNNLLDQALLAQGAFQNGFVVDDAMVDQRINQLISELGGGPAGEQALNTWMAAYGYAQADFRRDLQRAIAAAWMRDTVTAALPSTAEQVHARQILVYQESQAQEILGRLQAGADFAALVAEYAPGTRGDLGWFPRGYLTDSKLEEVAFRLEPGQTSPIIQTRLGYHILQVVEKDAQRALEPDALLALQTQALQRWLSEQRSQSDIELLVSG
jgi:peptidyl-prolyl cis-trans isomerase C